MKILPYPISFEWDEGNIDKNLLKHNVTSKEAEEVFDNDLKFIVEDELHSLDEKRYMMWGVTKEKRKLSIFFTIRKSKIRIISARDQNKKERRFYEEKIKVDS